VGAFHCIMIFLIEKYEDVYAKKKKFKLINWDKVAHAKKCYNKKIIILLKVKDINVCKYLIRTFFFNQQILFYFYLRGYFFSPKNKYFFIFINTSWKYNLCIQNIKRKIL
jgi:hypothetical protein